jgi:hypothetical protein
MKSWQKYLGFIWASPVTALGLAYTSLFQALGWYEWKGIQPTALVWRVKHPLPKILSKFWNGWRGHTIGNVVVLNTDNDVNDRVLRHELVHTRQYMRLGVLHPLVYLICLAAAKFGCDDCDPYYDCIFEIDARRSAGQIVDIRGAVNRLKMGRKNKNKSKKQ